MDATKTVKNTEGLENLLLLIRAADAANKHVIASDQPEASEFARDAFQYGLKLHRFAARLERAITKMKGVKK